MFPDALILYEKFGQRLCLQYQQNGVSGLFHLIPK